MRHDIARFLAAGATALLIAVGLGGGPAVEPLFAQPNCIIRLDKLGATAPISGGTFTVTVFPDPANCNYQVSTLTPAVGTIADGPGNTAVVTVIANPGTSAREGRFLIGDQVFRVVQAGADAETPWHIGDVFVGAGSEYELPGVYKTLAPQGALKLDTESATPANVVPDLLDGAGFYSSGCTVDPTAASGNGHLFTASWRANTLSVFDGATHQLRDVFPLTDPRTVRPEIEFNVGVLAAIPYETAQPLPSSATGIADDPSTPEDEFVAAEIQAFEQVVFANNGEFYVGTHTPPFDNSLGLGHGFLLRFRYAPSAAPAYRLVLTGWWKLDAGARADGTSEGASGVDQFDLSSDQQTIFYTSEDPFIRSYNVGVAGGAPTAIRLKDENGQPMQQVRALGIRILPGPLDGNGNATGDGSAGFLVAANGDTVYRVDAQGRSLARYSVPNPFALSLTPDAQFFWTADQANGDVYRFHIASGAREKFDAGAPGIFGLCVKREYSAATSGGQCFNRQPDGSYRPDDTAACRTPAVCSGIPGKDISGQPNNECFAPGFSPPVFENQGPDPEGTVVNLDLNRPGITLGGIIGLDAIPGLAYSSSTGTITGTIATSTCSPPPSDPSGSAICPFQLTVKWVPGTGVINVIHWVETSFTWLVTHGNVAPVITLQSAQPVTLPVLIPATIQLRATDPETADFVLASVTGLPPGLSAPYMTWAGMGWLLDIEGIPAVDPNLGPAYPVRVDVWDCSKQRAEAINAELRGMKNAGATPAEIDAVLRTNVADALADGSCYHGATTLQFTITVVNHPPTLAPVAQSTLINTAVSYQIPANDADGHPLTWTINNLPTGLSADANGLVTGTPTVEVTAQLVEVTVRDIAGASVTTTFPWTVFSNRPPVCDAATITPSLLWSPNHKLVPFSIANVTDPDGDRLTITITSITQNQPVNEKGDGNTGFDATGVGTSSGAVRAERTGDLRTGDGRVYEVTFTATDGKLNGTCGGALTIAVPHDQGRHSTATPNACRWNSVTGEQLGTCAPLTAPVRSQR